MSNGDNRKTAVYGTVFFRCIYEGALAPLVVMELSGGGRYDE